VPFRSPARLRVPGKGMILSTSLAVIVMPVR
jgi:hypothetical protein